MVFRYLCVLVALLLMFPLSTGRDETKRAKVLLLGPTDQLPVTGSWLESDPLTSPTYVPSNTHLTTLQGVQIQKYIRLYFPRNYDRLLEFEYIMITGVEIYQYTQTQQQMLHDAVLEEGLGSVQSRSVQSMADFIAHPWAESIVSDMFPNDADRVVSDRYSWENLFVRYVINTNPNVPPIFTPYKDLEGVGGTLTEATTVIAIPKEGAVVTSYVVGGFPQGFPGIYPDPGFRSPGWMPQTMFWRYGNGTTWTHHDVPGAGAWDAARNPYAPDMILAEFLFATGREMPNDVVLVHRLRGKFANFLSQKNFIYSLLDFIDKFGANSGPVISKMKDISGVADRGRSAYVRQDYSESMSIIEGAIVDLEALRSETMNLKDRALFWIYLIEWMVVSGAFLLSGYAIWSLMVRRKLYQEIGVTRLTTVE